MTFQIAAIVIAIVVVLALLASGYVKAPPDTAFIISGLRKEPRILIGRAGIKIPFLERVDKLYLGQMTVDIKTEQSVPTNDFINVDVDAVAKVRIATDREINIGTDENPIMVKGILLASKNFLNMKPDRIAEELQDSLQGNMREIIGTLDLRKINTDRDSFSDQVMDKASKDMDKLGIEIISCNIQNVTDENGLIRDLGADNTSKIKKDAAIAKANADKEVQVAQAEASRQSNDARVIAEREIAQKNTELEITKSELFKQSETKRAEAEAAYEIQNQIQQKEIQAQTVNAQIAKAEREAELREKEVKVQEQTLEATIKKKADADKYAAIARAEAERESRKAAAEADKYADMQKAEAIRFAAEQEAAALKAKGEGEAAALKAKGEGEAAGIKAKGEAEADAIRAKGEAEAAAMEKKAEAYQKYNGAAMAEMMIKIMPQMAAEIAKPLSSIESVRIYGGSQDGNSGVSNVTSNMPVIMKQVFDTMSEATGVDFTEIMKANTYDAKVNKNINLTSDSDAVKKAVDTLSDK